MRLLTKIKSAKKFSIPVARWEFTTVECYINVGSLGDDGHDEAVRQNREVCPNHLNMDTNDHVLRSRIDKMCETFPCDCCGVCCKNIRYSIFYTEELDRGDGVCKHLTEDNLCAIYAERPIFCNIDVYYDKFLSKWISRRDFHEINHAACERLKELK